MGQKTINGDLNVNGEIKKNGSAIGGGTKLYKHYVKARNKNAPAGIYDNCLTFISTSATRITSLPKGGQPLFSLDVSNVSNLYDSDTNIIVKIKLGGDSGSAEWTPYHLNSEGVFTAGSTYMTNEVDPNYTVTEL